MEIFTSSVFQALISVLLTIVSFFSTLVGLPAIPHKGSIDMEGYNLVWSDEFDGDKIDTSKWSMHRFEDADTVIRHGSYWNMDMCVLKGGALHIGTKYFENGLKGNGKPGWYTCAIDTTDTFESSYGYYECRCILPKGNGLWSAFWIWDGAMGNVDGSGKDGAEIDIFESPFYSNIAERNSVSSAIHYDGYGEAHRSTTVHQTFITDNNPYEEFNTYGLEWTEDEYIFYINGVEVGRSDFGGVSQIKEHMILSVEVGGENAVPADSWAGPSIDTNKEPPTDFIIDYVRYYSK